MRQVRFTTNVVKAAPVKWDQEIVYHQDGARVVVCNSGDCQRVYRRGRHGLL